MERAFQVAQGSNVVARVHQTKLRSVVKVKVRRVAQSSVVSTFAPVSTLAIRFWRVKVRQLSMADRQTNGNCCLLYNTPILACHACDNSADADADETGDVNHEVSIRHFIPLHGFTAMYILCICICNVPMHSTRRGITVVVIAAPT